MRFCCTLIRLSFCPPLPPPRPAPTCQMEWPTVAEVHAYRAQVYRLVTSVIQAAPDSSISNISMDSPYWALPLSMEHERIHIDTSSVLIRELPLECVARPATWPQPHVSGFGIIDDDGDINSHGNINANGNVNGSDNGGSNGSSPPQPLVDNPLVPVEGARVRLGKPRDFPR